MGAIEGEDIDAEAEGIAVAVIVAEAESDNGRGGCVLAGWSVGDVSASVESSHSWNFLASFAHSGTSFISSSSEARFA